MRFNSIYYTSALLAATVSAATYTETYVVTVCRAPVLPTSYGMSSSYVVVPTNSLTHAPSHGPYGASSTPDVPTHGPYGAK
ncbi:hypothetical protein AYI68_g4677, partial [Smittium mucronatum]